MSNTILALDCGKAQTKIAILDSLKGTVNTNSYPTKVKNVALDENCDGTCTATIEYDGNKYAINSIGSKTNLSSNSKLDFFHKIMALYAIAINVNNGDNVSVAINCPYSDNTSQDDLVKFRDGILPKGDVEVTINGTKKSFYISNVFPIPEGVSAQQYLWTGKSDSEFGIIDIGGLNSTCTYYNEEGIRDARKSFLDKTGYLKVCEENLSKINTVLDANFGFDSWIKAVSRGAVKGYEAESSDFIKDMLDNMLSSIEASCIDHNWNTRACDLIFVGGASLALKDRILAKYPNATIPEKAEFANVLGAIKFLAIKKGISIKI